jgi:membrane protein DedA with SNARE-associated domain
MPLLLQLLAGILGGIVVAIGVLAGGWWTLHAMEPEKRFALEHSTVYLVLILGAGFGAVTAALLRRKPPSGG